MQCFDVHRNHFSWPGIPASLSSQCQFSSAAVSQSVQWRERKSWVDKFVKWKKWIFYCVRVWFVRGKTCILELWITRYGIGLITEFCFVQCEKRWRKSLLWSCVFFCVFDRCRRRATWMTRLCKIPLLKRREEELNATLPLCPRVSDSSNRGQLHLIAVTLSKNHNQEAKWIN